MGLIFVYETANIRLDFNQRVHTLKTTQTLLCFTLLLVPHMLATIKA